MIKESIYDRLSEKMSNELDDYKQELLQKEPSEIIDSAYEYAMKTEIVFMIESRDLSENVSQKLLSMDNPLDEIYREWLDMDSSFSDLLEMAACNLTDENEADIDISWGDDEDLEL